MAYCSSFVLFILVAVVTVTKPQSPVEETNMEEWLPQNFPRPHQNSQWCLGDKSGYVCDPNHILTQKQMDTMHYLLKRFHDLTQCPCSAWYCETHRRGYPLSIAIVKKLKVTYNTTGASQALNFVTYLGQTHWPDNTCEANIVLLYSKDDGILYSYRGRVSRRILTAEVMNTMIQQIGWRFRDGDVASGFYHLIKLIHEYLTGNRFIINPYEPRSSALTGGAGAASLPGMFCLGMIASLWLAL